MLAARCVRISTRRVILQHQVRHCSASASASTTNNKPITGAVGSRGARGSGKSLIGSAARGVRGDKLDAMKSGDYGVDGDYSTDAQLEGADVLMEVLAEDHRASKTVEFVDEESLSSAKAIAAGDAERSSADVKPFSNFAQRKYLSHRGVSGATVFARAREAGQNRAEKAMEAAFVHRLPPEAKAQREHELRSRARQRDHDVIETRIQEAMASGAFDSLPGRGKPPFSLRKVPLLVGLPWPPRPDPSGSKQEPTMRP